VAMDLSFILLQLPRFREFDAADAADLSVALVPRSYADGEELFHVGGPPDHAYILVQGHVNVTRPDNVGRPYPVVRLGLGEVLGFVALVDNRPRSATATADGAVIALALPRGAFMLLYESRAPISLRFQRLVATLLAEDVREVTARTLEMMATT
jgi:CRP/FNR family transcriptional regulator, cyclic AMP receptor protein